MGWLRRRFRLLAVVCGIHGETRVLEREFGDAYQKYRKTVHEILPFPPRKH